MLLAVSPLATLHLMILKCLQFEIYNLQFSICNHSGYHFQSSLCDYCQYGSLLVECLPALKGCSALLVENCFPQEITIRLRRREAQMSTAWRRLASPIPTASSISSRLSSPDRCAIAAGSSAATS